MSFQQYRLGSAAIGLMFGFSMCITLLFPGYDFRTGVSTWVGLDKQLSVGRVIGFSYEDPTVRGEGKPITVLLDKDPGTGAPIDPPLKAYVYKAGIKFSPGINHTELLGRGVEELSIEKGKIKDASMSSGAVFTLTKGEFRGGDLDYVENTTATRGWQPEAVLAAAGDKNMRYVGKGKTIFIAQGCWWCHTLLPEQTQDWQAFGAPPFLGDFNGEMPTAFGSDRKAPDLLHVASRNSSREWMELHFFNPRLVQPNSIMPRFDYLWGEKDAEGKTIDFVSWRKEYKEYLHGQRVYAPEVPVPASDSQARALIDWVLTSLK